MMVAPDRIPGQGEPSSRAAHVMSPDGNDSAVSLMPCAAARPQAPAARARAAADEAAPGAAATALPFGKEGPDMQRQERTFARDAGEVPWARRFVRQVLAGHPAAADAELLASEVVTNAVLHAGDGATVTVAVSVSGAAVHIAVVDRGTASVPHWRDTGPDAEGGRGFRLVNEIASRWGFVREKTAARTTCWFDVPGGEAA